MTPYTKISTVGVTQNFNIVSTTSH